MRDVEGTLEFFPKTLIRKFSDAVDIFRVSPNHPVMAPSSRDLVAVAGSSATVVTSTGAIMKFRSEMSTPRGTYRVSR